MKFCELLNKYIQQLGCTGKDLSERAGISAATMSRYRSGERLPDLNSDTVERLCTAVVGIAADKGQPAISRDEVLHDFLSAEDFENINCEHLLLNFNTLLSVLSINISKLCRSINYDTSTVFRFRNGTRRPAEPKKFAAAVAGYVIKEFDSARSIAILSRLIGRRESELLDDSVRFELLLNWLLSQKAESDSSVFSFLDKLNSFDFNEFVKSTKFDKIKVPSAAFQIPSSKTYFGLKEMMESELDFLKATVLSSSTQPVTMYSDMPIKEMANDSDFSKKWVFGMAVMLKKGLKLNQIHNIDRNTDEMMLGLENWIPMYMTGQISPYYLKNVQSNTFLHFLKVSGAAALSGEAISGFHSNGKYYLTKSKKEVAYYSRRAQELLSCASPLMDIYRSDKANELNAFLLADSEKTGKRRSILSTLPIHTISDNLLSSMLKRHGLTDRETASIFEFVAAKRKRVGTILENNVIVEEIFEPSEDDFLNRPFTLDLSGAFCERDISYTRDEYAEHLQSTQQFAKNNPNYILKKTSSHAFRNLQIVIHEGRWAMISKNKAPSIHFVIYHPKLLSAVEKYIPPTTTDSDDSEA